MKMILIWEMEEKVNFQNSGCCLQNVESLSLYGYTDTLQTFLNMNTKKKFAIGVW